jgi:hypothetical protein
VGLLDATEEKPPSKLKRYLITVLVFIVLGGGGLWFLLRYHAEKTVVYHFMNAVVAGDMDKAYGMWSPSPSYSLQDFIGDWGPNGVEGPVKSFNVKGTYRPPDGSSGVVVIVEVSPYQPFPDKDDLAKQSKTQEVRLWVQFKDRLIQFPPPQYSGSSLRIDPGFVNKHHGYVASNGIDTAARGALQALLVGGRFDGRFAQRTNQDVEQFLRNGHRVSPSLNS